MNIFEKIVGREYADERRLGLPLYNRPSIERRKTMFAYMTGGRGFQTPPKESDGERAKRKAAARARMNAKIFDEQYAACDALVERGVPYEVAVRRFGSLAGRLA